MKEQVFTKIKITTGEVLTIKEPNVLFLMRAQNEMTKRDEEYRVGILPYILEQIIFLNNEAVTLEWLCDLPIVDYTNITESLSAFFIDIKK